MKSTSYFLLKLNVFLLILFYITPLENDSSLILIKNTVDRIKVRRKNQNKGQNDNNNDNKNKKKHHSDHQSLSVILILL